METPANTARVAGAPFSGPGTPLRTRSSLAAVAAFSFLSGGYVLGRSTPVAVGAAAARRPCGSGSCAAARALPPCFLAALGAFARVHSVERALGALVVRPGPDLGVVRSHGLLPRRRRGPRIHLVPAAAAADGRLRLPRRGDRGGRVRVPRQGAARRRDTRAHLRATGQPRRLLERARAHDGDGPRAWRWPSPGTARPAPRCARSPPPPPCPCASPSSSRSRAAAGSRSSWRSCCTSRSRRRGSRASSPSLAVVAPVALVLWRLRGLDTLFTETTDDALRTLQGGALLRWAIAALLVTAGVQLAVALLHRAVPWPRWSTIAAGAAVLAARRRGRVRRLRALRRAARRRLVGQGQAARTGHRRRHGGRRQRTRAG